MVSSACGCFELLLFLLWVKTWQTPGETYMEDVLRISPTCKSWPIYCILTYLPPTISRTQMYYNGSVNVWYVNGWLQGKRISIAQRDVSFTCQHVCNLFFVWLWCLIVLYASGDKVRIVNTTMTVGSRAMSARCEVRHSSFVTIFVSTRRMYNTDMEWNTPSSGSIGGSR